MPFLTYQERVELLTPPTHFNRHFKARNAWVETRRQELGFGAYAYDQGLEFSRRSAGKRGVEWILRDRQIQSEVISGLDATYSEEDWSLACHSAGLIAEGRAADDEEAWAAACAKAGTDRLELGSAADVESLKKARSAVNARDRLASLNPSEADAKVQRFVYAEVRRSDDDYGWSKEYRARRQRFCYRRFRLVKETAKFYFCDLENGETIDRDGVVDEELEAFRFVRRGASLTRIRKDLWDTPESWGNVENTARRYIRSAPYGVSWIWLDFETMVEELDAARVAFLRQLGHNDSSNWMSVLGIELGDREFSTITSQELKRFYRRAVQKAHPDKGGTAEAFQAVQAAYETAQRMVAAI